MVELITATVLLLLGYIFGSQREKSHFEDLRRREAQMLHKIAARADRGPTLAAGETMMVAASVVIASDYFKNFVGILKSFFGGRLATHEALMDRARREALCRIKEKALAWGAHEIVRVRYETSFLDQLGVEVSAYGTAVKK